MLGEFSHCKLQSMCLFASTGLNMLYQFFCFDGTNFVTKYLSLVFEIDNFCTTIIFPFWISKCCQLGLGFCRKYLARVCLILSKSFHKFATLLNWTRNNERNPNYSLPFKGDWYSTSDLQMECLWFKCMQENHVTTSNCLKEPVICRSSGIPNPNKSGQSMSFSHDRKLHAL